MVDKTDPWSDIENPGNPGYENVRRADADHPLDFFRGKLFDGRYLFRLITGAPPNPGIKLPKLTGIDVALGPNEGGGCQLTLTLISSADVEIFRALCANLIDATRRFGKDEEPTAFGVVIARLWRWQQVFKEKRRVGLTKSEQIGLYGELLVLRDIFLLRLNPYTALSAWRGPSGDEQDFMIRDWLMEVKTQLSSSDRKIHVSSQDQLDITSGRIVLFHQVLSITEPDQEGSATLNELVAGVQGGITKAMPEALDLFEARLIEAGYERMEEYGNDHMVLTQRVPFEIIEGFPLLAASDVPAGVTNVSYDVMLEACTDYQRDETEILEEVFGVDG